jgi:two-component system, OmpR family, sensor histidine kinase TorS
MSLRILVVEQGRHAREGLRDILASDGHEVSVAADADSGFDRVASQRFDLLLLDADLSPGRRDVGVFDLLRLARRGHPSTCGIMLSSSDEDIPPGDLTERGVVAVLEKPLDLSWLRFELESLTSRLPNA